MPNYIKLADLFTEGARLCRRLARNEMRAAEARGVEQEIALIEEERTVLTKQLAELSKAMDTQTDELGSATATTPSI